MMMADRSAGFGGDDAIIVIGAGIIGASIAYHLAKRGADVLIIDRTGPASGATGKSFAWINANHVADDAYHRFRYQSLSEYRRLDQELEGALGVQWGGALCFDVEGEALDHRLGRFRALGYPAEPVSDNGFGHIEPNYQRPPKRALRLALEGSIEPRGATVALIAAAVEHGARTLYGPDVIGLQREGDRLIAVRTSSGSFEAKAVVVAAGTGAGPLLADIGLSLPMADRPGLMLHSTPIDPVLSHVIWGDRIHIKQQQDGRLVIGEIFSKDRNDRDQRAIVGDMLEEARRHLTDIDIDIETITVGMRPIPSDGMPVIGRFEAVHNLYLAVMHSGITLAPIVGRMAAEELLDDVTFDALAPYRPGRFAAPIA